MPSRQKIYSPTTQYSILFFTFFFSVTTPIFTMLIFKQKPFAQQHLIFAVYFFTNYYLKNQKRELIYTSLLICWIIFLRPVYLPILLLFAGFILLNKNVFLAKKIKNTFILFIPFLICDGAWITHNYIYHKKFIQLTISALYPYVADTYLQPMFEFVESWGGCAHAGENNDSPVNWFDYYYPGRIKPDHIDSLPDNIYTSKFNKDSLVHLKILILKLQQPHLDSFTNAVYENELRTKFTLYKQSIAQEKPFLYYVVSPIKLTGLFLYGPETKDYLERGKVSQNIGPFVIVFNNIFYLLIVTLGFIGVLILTFKGFKGNRLYLLIALIPLYVLVIHPIVLRYAVNRFLMPVYPFLIVSSAYLFFLIFNRYFRPKAKV